MDLNVPLRVIKRLPVYYRTLKDLNISQEEKISSLELSKKTGFTASQIRQDLGYFGEFGRNGYGYNVSSLYKTIGHILGMDSFLDTIIIGAGNLARAIIYHKDFFERGIKIVGIFDKNKELIGKKIDEKEILDIKDLEIFCSKNKPKIAVLCLPKDGASNLVPKLISYGINGFWNFSNFNINKNYKDIVVENVYLNDSLMTLSCLLNQIKEKR